MLQIAGNWAEASHGESKSKMMSTLASIERLWFIECIAIAYVMSFI